jgi:hypothetical protein
MQDTTAIATQDASLRITWTKVGDQYTRSDIAKRRVACEIERFEWHDLVPGLRMPFSQGYAINRLIQDTHATARRAAWNGSIGPYGLYGIEFTYRDGTAQNYYVDDGLSLVCVRSDFRPNSEGLPG